MGEDLKFERVDLHAAWGPHEENDGGFILTWSCSKEHPAEGFGELSFAKMKDGTIRCDNECIGKEFIKAAFDHFLDTVQMDWEQKDGKWVYQRESKPAPKEVREEIVKRIREGNVQLGRPDE